MTIYRFLDINAERVASYSWTMHVCNVLSLTVHAQLNLYYTQEGVERDMK